MSEEKYIETATGKWEAVIGLEVHAQVISESKLFSSSSTVSPMTTKLSRAKLSANSKKSFFSVLKSTSS